MNDGESMAFPGRDDAGLDRTGLTKRKYFAAAALTGLLAAEPAMAYKVAAEVAVSHADALIKELLKEPGQ